MKRKLSAVNSGVKEPLRKMKFTIDEIIAGWLNITLDFGEDVYCIMATDVWKTDSPRMIMDMAACALKSEDAFYAVLDNEPGAWVLSLDGKGSFTIYLSKEDLQGRAELSGCDKAYETAVSVREFAEEVLSAFAPYSHGSARAEYEAQWAAFPDDEFNALKKAISDKE